MARLLPTTTAITYSRRYAPGWKPVHRRGAAINQRSRHGGEGIPPGVRGCAPHGARLRDATCPLTSPRTARSGIRHAPRPGNLALPLLSLPLPRERGTLRPLSAPPRPDLGAGSAPIPSQPLARPLPSAGSTLCGDCALRSIQLARVPRPRPPALPAERVSIWGTPVLYTLARPLRCQSRVDTPIS